MSDLNQFQKPPPFHKITGGKQIPLWGQILIALIWLVLVYIGVHYTVFFSLPEIITDIQDGPGYPDAIIGISKLVCLNIFLTAVSVSFFKQMLE